MNRKHIEFECCCYKRVCHPKKAQLFVFNLNSLWGEGEGEGAKEVRVVISGTLRAEPGITQSSDHDGRESGKVSSMSADE